MSTLNCPEEVYLAEKMIEIHPWFEMIKFARRVERQMLFQLGLQEQPPVGTNILVCGYHGWHDWYISVNLHEKDGLSKHLLAVLIQLGFLKVLRANCNGV